jgi:Sigma-70, region 4
MRREAPWPEMDRMIAEAYARAESVRRNPQKPRGRGRQKLPDNEVLRQMYVVDKFTLAEIADVFDCSRSAVCSVLKTAGIARRPRRYRRKKAARAAA